MNIAIDDGLALDTLLSLQQISCKHDAVTVVNQVSFDLKSGENLCLLGPSGCGKTSLLRVIAGFHAPSEGQLFLRGELAANPDKQMPVQAREVGMIFQEHALFPHLTVADNILFGLINKQAKQKKHSRLLEDLLRLIRLEDIALRYPHELSGGQKQRVALARALAVNPDLLLMDEPFASLDAELRLSLAADVKRITAAQGISSILVTHDQAEAFAMSDTIAVMHQGRIQQMGTPEQLYHQPNNLFVAQFIGDNNCLEATLTNENHAQSVLGNHQINSPEPLTGTAIKLIIRPEDIFHNEQSAIRARVIRKQFKGPFVHCFVQLNNQPKVILQLQRPSEQQPALGDELGISVKPKAILAFNP